MSASSSSAKTFDLPEFSVVTILDAYKESFLRSQGSLIQTIGRAALHLEGRAILYAERQGSTSATSVGFCRWRFLTRL